LTETDPKTIPVREARTVNSHLVESVTFYDDNP